MEPRDAVTGNRGGRIALAARRLDTAAWLLFLVGLTGCGTAPVPVHQGLRDALAQSDAILQAAVDEEEIPGAVCLVGWQGRIVHHRAFGSAQLFRAGEEGRPARLARPVPMAKDTVFDLASLTKVFATTFGVMLLVDQGKVRLDAPVHTYLPSFRGPRKDRVTVRHLLTHSAGLHPWKPVYYHAADGPGVLDFIGKLDLPWPVGRERHYSDLGFMLLGSLIEAVSGRRLDAYLATALYGPLGLPTIGFLPRDSGVTGFAATSHGNPFERKMVGDPTFGYRCQEDVEDFQRWRHHTLVGEVNDGNAFYAHRGVAGHAGLFAAAADLNVLLNLLLDEGVHRGKRLVSAAVVAEFLAADRFGNGLGWAKSARVLRATNLTVGAFGHTGFTGTYAVAVPEHDLTIILLTNRQNLGVDASGRYRDLSKLQAQVVERVVGAVRGAASGPQQEQE